MSRLYRSFLAALLTGVLAAHAIGQTETPPPVLFEARPGAVGPGQRSWLHIQYSGATEASLVRHFDEGRFTEVAAFGRSLPADYTYPVMPTHSTRYELALTTPSGQQYTYSTILRVVKPHDPFKGYLPEVVSVTVKDAKRDHLGLFLARNKDGTYDVPIAFKLRHAQTAELIQLPSWKRIWPPPYTAFTYPVPPTPDAPPVGESLVLTVPGYTFGFFLRVSNPNGVVRRLVRAPQDVMTENYGPSGLPNPAARQPGPAKVLTIVSFTATEAPAAKPTIATQRPRAHVLPVAPRATFATATVRVNVTFDVKNARVVRLFAGRNITWESDDLGGKYTSKTLPLTALRGTVFELHAIAERKQVTRKAPITKPSRQKGPGAESGMFNQGLPTPPR